MIKTKKRSIRTSEQNRYYWGCVIPAIMRKRKWHLEKAHQWVKTTFLNDGHTIASTAILSTAAFEALMQNIREFCTLFWETKIPLPNENPNFNLPAELWAKLEL